MCLSVVYKGKQKREAIAKLPEKFWVWKRAKFDGAVCRPTTFSHKCDAYYSGRQKASYLGVARCVDDPRRSAGYRAGWHCYRRRDDAAQWLTLQDTMLRCQARRRDIIAIGKQNEGDKGVTIVLSHLTFPAKCGRRPKK